MAIAAVIDLVQETLSRTHTLFAPPAGSGASAANNSYARLNDLAAIAHASRHTMKAATAGQTSRGYEIIADTAARGLQSSGANDAELGVHLRNADQITRTAHARSESIVTAANEDIASLTAHLNTPGGQKALLAVARRRVAEQHQLLQTTRDEGERVAAQVRTSTRRAEDPAPTLAHRETTMLNFGPSDLSQSPPPRPDPVPPVLPITGPAPLQDFTARQLQSQPVPGWTPPPPPVTVHPIKLPAAPNPVAVIDTNIDPGLVDHFPRCDGGDTAKAGLTVLGGMLTAVGSVAGSAPTLGTSLLGLSVAGMTIGSGIDDLHNCK